MNRRLAKTGHTPTAAIKSTDRDEQDNRPDYKIRSWDLHDMVQKASVNDVGADFQRIRGRNGPAEFALLADLYRNYLAHIGVKHRHQWSR